MMLLQQAMLHITLRNNTDWIRDIEKVVVNPT
jgi:hypothetical protein